MSLFPTASQLNSPSARIDRARQRFFDESQAPTGMVGEAVFESWARCLRLLGSPRLPAAFEPVTAGRTQLSLMKNRQLCQAWAQELPRLESILGNTSCAAMLVDATGVLIGASCVGRSHEQLMPVATRLGVNLSEDAVGTTAPGIAVRTGKPVSVHGGEHFFETMKNMYCAAAPIRDVHGRLAGVLDISSEHIPFEFDVAALVGMYAGAIENRLLVAQASEHLVIGFQVTPELLESPLVGLIGIDSQGRLSWQNAVARGLLGSSAAMATAASPVSTESLGLTLTQLTALPASGAAPMVLANGLTVWARAQMRAPDGHRGVRAAGRASVAAAPSDRAVAWRGPAKASRDQAEGPALKDDPPAHRTAPQPSTDASPRLRESNLELIQRTLRDCGGNVSVAAERLGVSRGLIYRRLRAAARLNAAADDWAS